jgi:hypothetical protein
VDGERDKRCRDWSGIVKLEILASHCSFAIWSSAKNLDVFLKHHFFIKESQFSCVCPEKFQRIRQKITV